MPMYVSDVFSPETTGAVWGATAKRLCWSKKPPSHCAGYDIAGMASHREAPAQVPGAILKGGDWQQGVRNGAGPFRVGYLK